MDESAKGDGGPSCLKTTCMTCLGTGTDVLVKMAARTRHNAAVES